MEDNEMNCGAFVRPKGGHLLPLEGGLPMPPSDDGKQCAHATDKKNKNGLINLFHCCSRGVMLVVLNSRSRTASVWKDLFVGWSWTADD